MSNLLIDIGNTALKAAWAEELTLGKTFRYQGERAVDFILSLTDREKAEVMAISTVREISAIDRQRLEANCRHLIIIGSGSDPVLSSHGINAGITSDRAASIIAARHLFGGQGCTIFDFGTMLTIDFVDKDGHYKGGNISPGCRTRFKAINRYSKTFPVVDTPDIVEEIGFSETESIASGVINGIMFEIGGYISSHPENIVVFTGGDAIYFAKRMKSPIFVVCNLVLMGLAILAGEYGVERKND